MIMIMMSLLYNMFHTYSCVSLCFHCQSRLLRLPPARLSRKALLDALVSQEDAPAVEATNEMMRFHQQIGIQQKCGHGHPKCQFSTESTTNCIKL